MSAGQWGSYGSYGSTGSTGWGRTDLVGRESYSGLASVGLASQVAPMAAYGRASAGYAGRIDVPWQDVAATATKKEKDDPAGYMSVYARWLSQNPDVDAYAKNIALNKLEKMWKDLSKIRVASGQASASEAQAYAQRAAGKEISKPTKTSTTSSSDDAILASLMAPTPTMPTVAASSSSSTTLILAGLGTVAAVGLLAWYARSK